jgi:pSer/pThr/pTyr-binding forkhead associated (FHA) protein
MNKKQNVRVFKNFFIDKQDGELARLKVFQGIDNGILYIIFSNEIFLGRDEKNDVVFSDIKISRHHAKIFKESNNWKIKELKSSNGIIYNNIHVQESILRSKDQIGLGETFFEFCTSDVDDSVLISSVKKKEAKISSNDNPNKRKSFLTVGLVLLFIFYLFTSSPVQKKSETYNNEKEKKSNINLSDFLVNSDIEKSSNVLFKNGFREYISGNYSRAKAQFEAVIQINPNHFIANIYLENCKKDIEASAKVNLDIAKKSFDAGKLKNAKSTYSRVMRLFYRDQLSPYYIEARDQYEKVIKEISGEG